MYLCIAKLNNICGLCTFIFLSVFLQQIVWKKNILVSTSFLLFFLYNAKNIFNIRYQRCNVRCQPVRKMWLHFFAKLQYDHEIICERILYFPQHFRKGSRATDYVIFRTPYLGNKSCTFSLMVPNPFIIFLDP